MSALVCGKRSQFEDISSPGASPPPSIHKRVRYRSGVSPSRHLIGSGGQASSPSGGKLSILQGLFPSMTEEELQRALEECGHDLDLTIKGLNLLCLAPPDRGLDGDTGTGSRSHGSPEERASAELRASTQTGHAADLAAAATADEGTNAQSEAQQQHQQQQQEGKGGSDVLSSVLSVEWVDAVVQEMMSARDLDDARQRAARALQSFGAAVLERGSAGKESEMQHLRQQVAALQRDNQILKRAVAIQHERHTAHEAREAEVNQLKQMLGQYQEQLRKLEVNNYALTLHLQKAQVGTSLPNRFHPDVF